MGELGWRQVYKPAGRSNCPATETTVCNFVDVSIRAENYRVYFCLRCDDET
jgi:hypothetical protein